MSCAIACYGEDHLEQVIGSDSAASAPTGCKHVGSLTKCHRRALFKTERKGGHRACVEAAAEKRSLSSLPVGEFANASNRPSLRAWAAE